MRAKGKIQSQTISAPDVVRAPVFIDAFSGCGGLSLGLMQAGWKGLFAIEKDKFAFQTLQHNLCSDRSRYTFDWPVWLPCQPWGIDDLLERHKDDLNGLRGTVDLLAGGPPCQGFSSAGKRRPDDPRNSLVQRYLQLVDILDPKIVLLENVRGFTSDFNSNDSAASHNFSKEVIASLETRYLVETAIVRASSFGVPQKRPRFFLIGLSRSVLQWPNLPPFEALRRNRKTFLKKKGLSASIGSRQALSDLEVGRNGTKQSPDSPKFQAIDYRWPRTAFQRAMHLGLTDVPSDMRLAKHRPDIIKRFQEVIALCKRENRLNTSLSREAKKKFGIRKSAFRVLDPLKPAPTITSMPDDLLHYDEPRTLTVRENARLQTFPDWFEFKGKYTTGGHLRRSEVPRFTQVANAVPPLLAEQLGAILLEQLRSARESSLQGSNQTACAQLEREAVPIALCVSPGIGEILRDDRYSLPNARRRGASVMSG